MLLIGLLLGIIFGPIISGGLAALFWSDAADGNRAQKIAGQLYDAVRLDPLDGLDISYDPPRHCSTKLSLRLSTGHASEADLYIYSALDRQRFALMRTNFESRANADLVALPKFVIGALHSCISSSPVADVCRSYVMNRVEKAFAVPASVKQKWIADANHIADTVWCAANPN